ncbi:MAG: hypothetical protein IJV31_03570 [Clostridia bacterium]|nr:hypothetical protein [Clostridia bacterium]
MMNSIDVSLETILGVTLIFIAIALGIYIAIAIFLNKFHKLVFGKGSALCWIPVANSYILGKLTINNIYGWVLVICTLLNASISITNNGQNTTVGILPESISSPISTIFGIVQLITLIYAIVKYNKLKNEEN